MRNNRNFVTPCNLSDKNTYCASVELAIEAGLKKSDFYLNLAYTDYGGDFFDRVVIEYFKKHYPDNIVFENTSWCGQNAFIFGEPAKEFAEVTSCYLLGFEEIEEFYINMEYDEHDNAASDYYEDNKEYFEDLDSDVVIGAILNFFSSYASMLPNRVDYSESDLEKYLSEELNVVFA